MCIVWVVCRGEVISAPMENDNCAYAQTAQGLVANKPGSAGTAFVLKYGSNRNRQPRDLAKYCDLRLRSRNIGPTAGTNAEISYAGNRVGARARLLRRGRASFAESTASSDSQPGASPAQRSARPLAESPTGPPGETKKRGRAPDLPRTGRAHEQRARACRDKPSPNVPGRLTKFALNRNSRHLRRRRDAACGAATPPPWERSAQPSRRLHR
eukprot:2104100-Pleurochrysis_carterae.AAC.1